MIHKTIRNMTNRLIILRLNSGRSLFIEPGSVSASIPNADLKDNPMVHKLRDRRMITITEVDASPATGGGSEPKPPAPQDKPATQKKQKISKQPLKKKGGK